jgi:hypothetical protein
MPSTRAKLAGKYRSFFNIGTGISNNFGEFFRRGLPRKMRAFLLRKRQIPAIPDEASCRIRAVATAKPLAEYKRPAGRAQCEFSLSILTVSKSSAQDYIVNTVPT